MAKQAVGPGRPFALHWGSGHIAEEATWQGEHHRPAIQLLQFDDGHHEIRFCHFDEMGRFQRSPLIVGNAELQGLRDALKETPRLRQALQQMVG